ncbi:hypothetical protein CKO15_05610 [Halorhodospira abdelmalekii]|uniref:pyrimidine reductase n=1 Tax=Halorhodospira abdelmalekii TaxID=421629 RepID=UPI001903C022|nr:pyrimidine reductase [Halorhodospira abdelmalekii]MBK1734773.1 hypothetical protein [Halorhodospira abdelmalekii]
MRLDDSYGLALRLYPQSPTLPASPGPLCGLYLGAIRSAVHAPVVTTLYTNFIASLDGRISLEPVSGGCRVPASITNPRDWRLFQELAAQADCLITTGRYLREWASGCAQAPLPLDSDRYPDLAQWRQQAGLPPQPDVAVVSTGKACPIPQEWIEQGRRIWLFLPAGRACEVRVGNRPVCPSPADRSGPTANTAHTGGTDNGTTNSGVGIGAHYSGTRLRGRLLRETLSALGYRCIYSVAGPRIAHTLIADAALDTLFVTTRHQLLGGNSGTFETLLEGEALRPTQSWPLTWLYLDVSNNGAAAAEEGAGQHFARYDRKESGRRDDDS